MDDDDGRTHLSIHFDDYYNGILAAESKMDDYIFVVVTTTHG